jgi:GGDEF domain-containing protein
MTRSLDGARQQAGTSADGFDPVTGFALPARLAMRIRDCLGGASSSLVVGCCQLANGSELASSNAPHALRVLLRLGDCLREQLPFRHTLARTGEFELCFLLPDAGDEAEARVRDLAAKVSHRMTSDASANFPMPLELLFGFALGPRDGADADVLLRAARRPRLRAGPPR